MDLIPTLMVLAAALAVAGAAMWGDRVRGRRPQSALALIPWHGLIFVSLTTALFTLVHLLALFGGA